ncbi:polysaccharide biosynthesis C-terminal domain-containing protein [Staphylococcus borealis]|uniref:polysaccharide biosynthesis C-terminal domain-containing protein n=1 Tax=Staphylococcus borealis TaxID=2742203 RepID=UPI000946A801|nr:polysaccharide biosynthesis C-terminal domain-containing protein [Staphylococcus borealis]MDO0993976.1 polysaccharide biosynthesis C-terminal domain-containing protein [Staphylococcus borealis]OLF30448.1 hypothetical protein BSZ10_07420 [Staphylococcus aureus]
MIKTFSLLFSQILSILLNFSVQLILANFYGKSETGTYLSIISIMNILSVLGLFGINKYYIFLKSKKGFIDEITAINIIKIYILMNILSIILMLFIGWINFSHYLLFIISSTLMMVLTNSIAIITSYIQVREKIIKVSFLQLIIPLLKVGGLILGAFLFQKLFKGYSIIVILVTLGILIINAIQYSKSLLHFNFFKKTDLILTLRKLTPYALLSVTFLMYTQGNTFYVGIWLDSKGAAYFGLAYLFLNTIFIFPTAIYQRLLAHKLLYLMYNSLEEFKKLLSNLQDVLIILSSVAILLIYLLAKILITTLFGESYLRSVEILQILAFIIPFRLLSISIGTVLSNDDHVKERIKVELIVTFLNFIANLILIKLLGINGAIISAILTELILSLSFAKVVREKFNMKVKYLFYLPMVIALIIYFANLPNYVEYIIVFLIIAILVKPIMSRLKIIKKYI